MAGYLVEVFVEDEEEKGIKDFEESLELAADDGVFEGYRVEIVNIEQID